MKYILLAFLALALVGLGYIRLAKNDTAVWHVDPQTVKRGPNDNQFLMRDTDGDVASALFDMSAQDLAQVFESVALSRPRVRRLAGDPEQLWMTYIQRSKWMGYPDYISVRAIPRGANDSALVIYSRSRYGRSDLGVNDARVNRWMEALMRRAEAEAKTAAE